MKVLQVIPAVAPRYGGPSAGLLSLCAALRLQGIDVTIAATDADGESCLRVETGTMTTYRGTPAIFFRRQFSESFKYSKPLASWLSGNVRSFDVVHVHAVLSHACLAAGRACRAAGVPYVVRPLGTLDRWSLGQKALKKRLLMWFAGRRLLRTAAAVQYTSRQEKTQVEAAFGLAGGVVIPLGVDAEAFCGHAASPATGESPYVLGLSRLHPVKGLEALIEAFVRAASPAAENWRMVLAGDGDAQYVAALKQLAAERGLAERVRFPGWVDGEPKRALIEGASLFAVPSLHESFGISLVEALAHGVPAIVSRHVHLAEEIEEAGAGWVADAEPAVLARALEEAMEGADERRRRGQAARVFAQRFAWPTVAREVIALYESCRVQAES